MSPHVQMWILKTTLSSELSDTKGWSHGKQCTVLWVLNDSMEKKITLKKYEHAKGEYSTSITIYGN